MNFHEGVEIFQQVVPLRQRNLAAQKYDPISKSQEGQMQILKAAENGDQFAAIYLYDRFQGLVTKVFWKYYLGPQKQFHKARLSQGAAEDFAFLAFEILIDGKRSPSPYSSFNSNVFNKNADLIKQFGYYFYRYLQNEAFKMIRAQKMGGITGNVEKETDISTVDYDTMGDQDLTAAPDHAEAIDEQEMIRAFQKYVAKQDARLAKVFQLAAEGHAVNDIAKQFGNTPTAVRNWIAKLQDMWKEFK